MSFRRLARVFAASLGVPEAFLRAVVLRGRVRDGVLFVVLFFCAVAVRACMKRRLTLEDQIGRAC